MTRQYTESCINIAHFMVRCVEFSSAHCGGDNNHNRFLTNTHQE